MSAHKVDFEPLYAKMASAPIPNIPGLKKNPQGLGRLSKSQNFKVIAGRRFIEGEAGKASQEPAMSVEDSKALTAALLPKSVQKDTEAFGDLSGRYSLYHQKKNKANKIVNLPFGPGKLPGFIEYDRKVLLFKGWFKEPVPESPLENERIRLVDIQYYLENDTMEMVEHKQGNSGLPQGGLLKRIKVPKADNSGFYTFRDINIGTVLQVFGKQVTIIDANESTRKYKEEVCGQIMDLPLPAPKDDYTVYLTDKMSRETGLDTTVPRNRMMHPMKAYMESILGRPVGMQDLGRFLKYDKKVLRFHCVWDDTDSLYGDIIHFKLHYYLVNDTIEIVPHWDRNGGRDKISKLLSRSKLVKEEGVNGKSDVHYHWTDLMIGNCINVFGRKLKVLGVDPFTREYAAENGFPMPENTTLPTPPVPVYSRPIPPPTGYGSEEDTLKNLWTFDPKPPLKDGAKAILNSGKVLRYGAKILSKYEDDAMRYFVIQYFMEDDTIAIQEPPIRNSGFGGGQFLARTKIMKNTEDKYTPYDLHVGATVQMLAHKFTIIDADDYTLNFMESRAHEGWPSSNIYKILGILRPKLEEIKEAILTVNHSDGVLTYDQIREILSKVGLTLDRQSEITFLRSVDPIKKKLVPSVRLLKRIESTA